MLELVQATTGIVRRQRYFLNSHQLSPWLI